MMALYTMRVENIKMPQIHEARQYAIGLIKNTTSEEKKRQIQESFSLLVSEIEDGESPDGELDSFYQHCEELNEEFD